ncbi:hypothetical protein BJX99DRAFT_255503 [Aspergillus californicus]
MTYNACPTARSRYLKRLKDQAADFNSGKITKKPPSCKTLNTANLDLKPQLQKPIGKVLAAEVMRRKERQTSALPPPALSRSGAPRSQTTSGRNHRRRAAPGGGSNGNSDSDSDDDERRGNPQCGDGAVSARRQPSSPQERDFLHQITPLDRPM